MKERSTSRTYKELDLVANAMMIAQSELFNHQAYIDNRIGISRVGIDGISDRLTVATRNSCREGSESAIRYLLQYPQLIKRVILLSSEDTNRTPFKYDFDSHSVFLALSHSNRWFSGSPANYNDERNRDSFLTKLIHSQYLDEVLFQNIQLVGGDWPDEKYIRHMIAQLSVVDSSGRTQNVLHLYRDWNVDRAEYIHFNNLYSFDTCQTPVVAMTAHAA